MHNARDRGVNSCSLSVCMSRNSCQLPGSIHLKFSGDVGDTTGCAYFRNQHDLLRNKKLLLMGTFGGIVKKAFFYLGCLMQQSIAGLPVSQFG